MKNLASRRRLAGEQAGVSLIEVLCAMVIVSLIFGAVAFATVGALKSGETARKRSELNSLVTSFGESIKGLPYHMCAVAGDYTAEFQDAEDALPSPALKLQGKLNATLSVVSVVDNDPGAGSCPGLDSGTQLVTLTAQAGSSSQTITIVKRTPNPTALPAKVDFDFVLRTGLNSPIVEYGLVPNVESSVGVKSYKWWCMSADDLADPAGSVDAWMVASPVGAPTRDPDFETTVATDPAPKCAPGQTGEPEYEPLLAPQPTDPPVTLYAALQVIDNAGIVYPTLVKPVQLPTSTAYVAAPTAVITQMTSPSCVAGLECDTDDLLRFNGSFSVAGVDRHLVKCLWSFSDGSDPIVFTGADCSKVENVVEHTFTTEGTHQVRLKVTNDAGKDHEVVREIVVQGVNRPRPTAIIDASLKTFARWNEAGEPRFGDGDVIDGYAPQDVFFSASSSHPNGDSTITGWEWRFGDAWSTAYTTETYAKRFESSSTAGFTCVNTDGSVVSGAFRAQLTVYASNGTSDSTALCVKVAALAPPPNFSFRGARGDCATRILGICWIFDPVWADFYFQWTSMPPVPVGDQIQILVRIEEVPEVGDQCVVPDETMILNPVNWPAGTGQYRIYGVINTLAAVIGQGLGDLINDDCRMKVGIRRTSVNGEQTEAWNAGWVPYHQGL